MTNLFRATELSDRKELRIIVEPTYGISPIFNEDISPNISPKQKFIKKEVEVYVPKPNGKQIFFDYFGDSKYQNFIRNVHNFEFSMYLNGWQGFNGNRSIVIIGNDRFRFLELFKLVYDFDLTVCRYFKKQTIENKTYYYGCDVQKIGYFDVFTGKVVEGFDWKKEGF